MLVLLDNGHGGLINANPQTASRRSHKLPNGARLFEGEFNRAIVNGIIQELTFLNIPYVNVCPEIRDVTLQTRVKRANAYKRVKNVFFISIHSNAGGGRGSEFFTSVGRTKSDPIANIFAQEYVNKFPDRRLRTDLSDGMLGKEKNFYVLRKTAMPAVLTENFFFDNREEVENILMTREGRQKIVDFHVNAIVRIKEEIFLEAPVLLN